MSSGPTYRQTAWSWAEHLRAGGSTTWSVWTASGAGADALVPAGWAVPGAAQLEFVRRLALAGSRDDLVPTGLADVVLGRSGPGRGLGQQPLSWPDDGVRRFGAPPIDPSDVPDQELVRVGVGTLTDLLLGAGVPDEPTTPRRRRTRTPAFALAGAPVTTSAVRRVLGAAGHVEGGRSPRVVLVAEPLDVALMQVWSVRVQRGAPIRWPGFVARWSGRRALPPSADYPALARLWADEVGPGKVHVVAAPQSAGSAAMTVAAELGLALGRPRAPSLRPRWQDLSPAAVDVARRVNAVLSVRVSGDRRDATVRALVTALARSDARPRPLTVPLRFQGWAASRACEVADELLAGGYPVHGDLVRLVPRFEGRPTRARRVDVLQVLVDACLGQAGADAHLGKAEQR